jgi:hypothetical protein
MNQSPGLLTPLFDIQRSGGELGAARMHCDVRSITDLSRCLHSVELTLAAATTGHGATPSRRGVTAAPGPASSGVPQWVRTDVGSSRRVNREQRSKIRLLKSSVAA